MSVDLNSLFNSLKSYQVNESNIQSMLNSTKTDEQKSIDNMTEEEKGNFYDSDDYKQYKANAENLKQITNVNVKGRNVQEIFGLGGTSSRFSYNCFDFLESDHEDYLDIVDFSPVMQQTIAKGEKLLPTFKYLHEDIFMSLYQFNAEVLPPEKMHIQSHMNRNILSQLVNTPAYIQLRKTCRCDLFNAGIGTEIIGKQAIEILEKELSKIKDFDQKKEALERLIEQEEKMDYLSEELDDLEELIEEMQMNGNTDSPEFEELMENYNGKQMSLNEARSLAKKMSEQCDELVEAGDELVDTMVASMDNSIGQATSEVQQVSDYVQVWGLGQGNDTKVPFSIKRSALERIRNSEYLKKFTDMIGKYKECAVAEQKKKDKSAVVEIKSVTIGDKIENALPSDKMNLCNETTKKDFYRRLTQGQLMTYDRDAQKEKNKGPIIVCIDQSGSMSGDKDMWAKALAVGILEIAQLQKREFACIPYDSMVRKTYIIHKDEICPDKIIDIASSRATGGTNFEKPLKEASKLIEDSNFKEAKTILAS